LRIKTYIEIQNGSDFEKNQSNYVQKLLNSNKMKRLLSVLLFTGILFSCNSTDKNMNPVSSDDETSTDSVSIEVNENLVEINTDDALIATALMAAPKENREGCTVIGYNMAGEFVTLKKGNNEFICLADDPSRNGFNAACYHKDLEPFMARGRELKLEGKSGKEIFDIREEEIKSGKLKMGGPGTTLHIYYGSKTLYDPETSEVEGTQYRYVIYMPWATSESTGLPESPIAPNHPWIMDPGTHKAHIMFTPLTKD
jgi:hypothetical protein